MIAVLQESMVECLKIPEHDRLIRLLEYEPEDFVVPSVVRRIMFWWRSAYFQGGHWMRKGLCIKIS